MATYSFLNVTATLAGASGIIDLGYGSAVSKEGITVSMAQERDAMTVGADGEVMHSLRMDKSGTIVVRLLYTSPQNAKLQAMFDLQTLTSTGWGANVITIRNKDNDEVITARDVAFARSPDRTYGEDGQMLEWQFNCGKIDIITGDFKSAA